MSEIPAQGNQVSTAYRQSHAAFPSQKGWGSGDPAPRPFRSGVSAVLAPRFGSPSQKGWWSGDPAPRPFRSGVSAVLAPRFGSPSQKGWGSDNPAPAPSAPGSPRCWRPASEARARRDGGRITPPPAPSAPGSPRCWRPAPEATGDASRLNRPPTGRTGASRRSSLRFGRNTPGIPPSRALSAGRLTGLGTHVTLSTGCLASRPPSACVPA